LPIAIAMPQKPIYRRLLVEIYGNMTFGLVQRVRHGHGKDADDARATLAKIGGRAVKPLLDALADQDVGQQRIAIDVLGYVENKNAALPLFSYATGSSDAQLRMRAMIACGALRDPTLLPKYDALLFPKDGDASELEDAAMSSDAVTMAAAWGVAKLGDPRAVPLLRKLTSTGSPQTRAIAVLGLGLAHDKGSITDVAAIARAVDSGNVARAAAAYALGELGADGEAPTLLTLAEGTDPLPRETALIALARLGQGRTEPPGGRSTLDAMADAIFAGADQDSARARKVAADLQQAGMVSLVMLASGQKTVFADTLPVPDGTFDVDAMISSLVPTEIAMDDRAAALVRFSDSLQRAALGALQTSGDGARAVLDSLGMGEGELEPFLPKKSGAAENADIQAARTKASNVAQALEPSIIPLARHPDASIRTKAIVLLSRSATPAAVDAVVHGVGDTSEAVQRVALAAIGAHSDAAAVAAVGKLLDTHTNWAMRVLAAQAMGRLGASGGGAAATAVLRRIATNDTYALVREAALSALASFDASSAKQLASQMAKADAEPRVRETAARIARGG
jgi:HEAT repeat protein